MLLAGIGISAWAEFLFPAWIVALSAEILTAGHKALPGSTGPAPPRLTPGAGPVNGPPEARSARSSCKATRPSGHERVCP